MNADPANGPAATGEEGSAPAPSLPWTEIEAAVRGLRFGEVKLVFHEGRVARIERLERMKVEERRR